MGSWPARLSDSSFFTHNSLALSVRGLRTFLRIPSKPFQALQSIQSGSTNGASAPVLAFAFGLGSGLGKGKGSGRGILSGVVWVCLEMSGIVWTFLAIAFLVVSSAWSSQSCTRRRSFASSSIQTLDTRALMREQGSPSQPIEIAISSFDNFPMLPMNASRAVRCHSDSRMPTAAY